MKKIFNIKVSIWSKWRVIFIFIIVSGLCTCVYNSVFTGRANSYHIVKVLGGLIVMSFILIYRKLLYPLKIEIDDFRISFYKNDILIYENSKDKLCYVRIIKNNRNEIVEVKLYFDDRNIVLYSPITIKQGDKSIDRVEDVFHYLVKSYNLKRNKVYGRVLGFGKKYENHLINEYWNEGSFET